MTTLSQTPRELQVTRDWSVQKMASDLGISYDEARGLLDMADRRAAGIRE